MKKEMIEVLLRWHAKLGERVVSAAYVRDRLEVDLAKAEERIEALEMARKEELGACA
jgi:hypothetical protein